MAHPASTTSEGSLYPSVLQRVLILRRVKILQVVTRLAVGGAPQNVITVAAGLPRDRYEVCIACGEEEPWEGSLQGRARALGVPVHVIPGLRREIAPVRDAMSFWRLYRFIRRGGFQIVHTHLSKAGVLGRLAARVAGVPVILNTYHGDVFESYFPPLKSRILIAFERLAAALSARLIEVSRATLNRHVAQGISGRERFVLIPNGVDLRLYQREVDATSVRRRLDLPLGSPVIGTVTRLAPVKRIDILLRAAEAVLKKRPDAIFAVVGHGELRARLQEIAAGPALRERVRFFGLRGDVADLLPAFDIVVLCSDDEGCPASLIEAMAAARPVVASEVGGIPELVEQGRSGLLVPRRDPVRLAEAILSLLDSPEQAHGMGLRGREIVCQRFDARLMVSRVDSLYRELMTSKGVRFADPGQAAYGGPLGGRAGRGKPS